MTYTHIDPDDREAVIWLQVSLNKLHQGYGAPRVRIGIFDSVTRKMVELYQLEHALPQTGKADAATLAHIQQALET